MVRPRWDVEIEPRAQHHLERLPVEEPERIIDAIDGVTTDPPSGDIVKLEGRRGEWRLRVGDRRAIFRRDGRRRVVAILGVYHRRDAYRD